MGKRYSKLPHCVPENLGEKRKSGATSVNRSTRSSGRFGDRAPFLSLLGVRSSAGETPPLPSSFCGDEPYWAVLMFRCKSTMVREATRCAKTQRLAVRHGVTGPSACLKSSNAHGGNPPAMPRLVRDEARLGSGPPLKPLPLSASHGVPGWYSILGRPMVCIGPPVWTAKTGVR